MLLAWGGGVVGGGWWGGTAPPPSPSPLHHSRAKLTHWCRAMSYNNNNMTIHSSHSEQNKVPAAWSWAKCIDFNGKTRVPVSLGAMDSKDSQNMDLK